MASLIQSELSELILKRLKDPRIGFITITDVDLTSDLKQAHVYYSLLGGEKGQTQKALERAAGFLQHGIAEALKLRFTPRLSFHNDPSLEEGEKIEKILHNLEAEKKQKNE